MVVKTSNNNASWCALWIAAVLSAGGAVCAHDAYAVAPGKAWTSPSQLALPGHANVTPDRFEPLRKGRLELVAQGVGGGLGIRGYGLVWADTAWAQRWIYPAPYHVFWPAFSAPDQQMLVWKTAGAPVDAYYSKLVVSFVSDDGVLAPEDTIAPVSFDGMVYCGASTASRQWVAVRDRDFSVLGFPEELRIFRRVPGGAWRSIGTTGLTGRWGMSLVPLDSVTAVLVSGEYLTGIHWGVVQDSSFTEGVPLSGREGWYWPHAATAPGGEIVVAWSAFPEDSLNQRVHVRRYREGKWSAVDDVPIMLPDSNQYFISDVQLDAAGEKFPAIAWAGYSPNHVDAAPYVWVSFPTDTAFGLGERLNETRGGENPVVTRDDFGDVWLSWWRPSVGDGYWMHSYTQATPSTPVVRSSAGGPSVQWTLSTRAPGSWWGILRGGATGPLEQIAKVRAGDSTAMVWIDTTERPSGPLRYAVERLCRDKRYVVRTAEAEWLPPTARLGLQLRSANPAAARVDLELTGARGGLVRLRLLDLQGRQVAEMSAQASGSGRDALSLTLPPQLRSGLYMIRVLGADGADSAPRKIVVLR